MPRIILLLQCFSFFMQPAKIAFLCHIYFQTWRKKTFLLVKTVPSCFIIIERKLCLVVVSNESASKSCLFLIWYVFSWMFIFSNHWKWNQIFPKQSTLCCFLWICNLFFKCMIFLADILKIDLDTLKIDSLFNKFHSFIKFTVW